MIDERYYKGKFKVKLLQINGKKAIIETLEPVIVKYKVLTETKAKGTVLICPVRMCWRYKKREKYT